MPKLYKPPMPYKVKRFLKYERIKDLRKKQYSLQEMADILHKEGYIPKPWRSNVWKIVKKLEI